MNKYFLLVFLFLLLTFNLVSAQKHYYFVSNNDFDTISNYKLKVYNQTDPIIYLPGKNNALDLSLEKIEKADSIVLYFDYWYQEKIPKRKFDKNLIYINKQLYLEEVVVEKKETKTIGTFNKNTKGINTQNSRGDIVSFELKQPIEIESFSILIHKNKVENSVFVPVLFLADSLYDPNKIYVYPKGKLLTLKDKFRKAWINIPLEKYAGKMKSQIFAGYIAKSSNIVFGVARAKKNTFLEAYLGSTRNVKEMWNKYISREENFYVPAVRIQLKK
ncbi:hypothetical protein [uncultured Mesonia sp.]